MADIDGPDAEEHGSSVDQLTPEEANRIIHSHRKVRYGKYQSMSPRPGCPSPS